MRELLLRDGTASQHRPRRLQLSDDATAEELSYGDDDLLQHSTTVSSTLFLSLRPTNHTMMTHAGPSDHPACCLRVTGMKGDKTRVLYNLLKLSDVCVQRTTALPRQHRHGYGLTPDDSARHYGDVLEDMGAAQRSARKIGQQRTGGARVLGWGWKEEGREQSEAPYPG